MTEPAPPVPPPPPPTPPPPVPPPPNPAPAPPKPTENPFDPGKFMTDLETKLSAFGEQMVAGIKEAFPAPPAPEPPKETAPPKETPPPKEEPEHPTPGKRNFGQWWFGQPGTATK